MKTTVTVGHDDRRHPRRRDDRGTGGHRSRRDSGPGQGPSFQLPRCDGDLWSGDIGQVRLECFRHGPLRDGVIVTLGAPPATADNLTYLELRVVGGPAAGNIHPLPMGTSSVGRGHTAQISVDDPSISRRHVLLTVDQGGVAVADAGSTNGTCVDGLPVGLSPVPLRQGMRLRMGCSTLTVAVPDVIPMSVRPTADGQLSFNRPPRLDAPDPTAAKVSVAFPIEPTARERPAFP